MQHVRALKEDIADSDAKVEEARKQFAEVEGQMRAEVEEETKLLHQEQNRNAELAADQTSLDQMIIDTDSQALSKCPPLCSPTYSLYQYILIPLSFDFFPRDVSGISGTRACEHHQAPG
jgi:hypothetical protein